MEYNSFYGGQKGASFVIVKTYPDIFSMCTDFAKGGDFKAVGYDEYVIINTFNKNHPDNGKIFRRGYDYNSERTIECYRVYDNETHQEIINGTEEQYLNCYYRIEENYPAGGAEYIGTVVGPAGEAPTLIMTTYAEAENKQGTEGFETQKSHGEYAPTTDLVPGKYDDGNNNVSYNDSIKWYCTSIRASNGEDTLAYLGFIIPYPVIEYNAATVSPYYHRTNSTSSFINENLIDRDDDGTHPFYEHWDIKIPKGIKGDTFKDFRVIIPAATDEILDWNTGQQYSGFSDDVSGSRAIVIYTYYHYDVNENGEPINYYIGDYNVISSFTLDLDGSVHIRYTHKTEGEDYPYLLKWITNIQFNVDSNGDTDTGHVIITYNTKRTDGTNLDKDEYDLDWIEGLSIDNDGTVHYQHTTRTDDDKQSKLLNWITNVALVTEQSSLSQISTDEGKLDITFNNNNLFNGTFTAYLKWVNGITLENNGELTLHFSGQGQDVTINEADPIRYIRTINLDTNQAGSNEGKLTVTYNTDLTQEGVNDTYQTSLKWVNGISLAADGNLTLHYSGGGTDQVITTAENHLKWIDSIELASNGVMTITYNDESTEDLGSTVKWVASTEILPNGNYVVTYNDSTTQTLNNLIKWIDTVDVGNDGTVSFIFNTKNEEDEQESIIKSKLMRWIDNISINPTTQKLEITYNNSDEVVPISQALNYIDQIAMPGAGDYKGHLLVYYTDPNKKGNITYDSKTGWVDVGDISYINDFISDVNDDITVLENRMDTFSALPDGSLSTVADAELVDIRNGADGVQYNQAGTAVRTQFNNLTDIVEDTKEHLEKIAYGAYITRTQTGNELTVKYGAADIPVKSAIAEIAIRQNGSGTPSSDNQRSFISASGLSFTCNQQVKTYDWTSQISAVYGGNYNITTGILTVTHEFIAVYDGRDLPGMWYSDRDVYSIGTKPSIGAQVVYELTTPKEYYFDTDEIRTILGDNYFDATTGKVIITYRLDTEKYVQNTGLLYNEVKDVGDIIDD